MVLATLMQREALLISLHKLKQFIAAVIEGARAPPSQVAVEAI